MSIFLFTNTKIGIDGVAMETTEDQEGQLEGEEKMINEDQELDPGKLICISCKASTYLLKISKLFCKASLLLTSSIFCKSLYIDHNYFKMPHIGHNVL